MEELELEMFDRSLERCIANPRFLDRFYEIFMASSPKVRQKFAHTDFARQNVALRDSLKAMSLAARDPKTGPKQLLSRLAERHSTRDLNIGAEFYDLWLDSLLVAVQESDPQYDPDIRDAWEKVMMVGINYLLAHY